MPPAVTTGVSLPVGAHGAADLDGEIDVPAKRPALVDPHRGHALVARRTGVGIGRLPDHGLFRVLELAALRDGQEVHAGGGEAAGVVDGILDARAARDDLVTEETAADGSSPRRLHDARPSKTSSGRRRRASRRAAVAVVTIIQAREEARHGVGVGVVQLDAVEAGLAGAARGGGEETRQGLRQVAYVLEIEDR